MSACPHCSADLPAGAKFCPACGTPATAPASARPIAPAEITSTHATPASTPGDRSSPASRFVPGQVLADRYRIVALLGRGGMGEVYRADDLKLGASVALKFLPQQLENDPGRRARILNEVRVARQISHPNVCRVHDIAEHGGASFVSMEYVDGEDLQSLLRRIGRLPEDKAVEVARQLCAGLALATAHDQGILHRDLKPANVMIDARGRVKITDFGLAELEHAIDGAEVAWGTPAYQAPEQAAGRAVTVQSDLYALGLVLYEVFTGKRAFEGSTPAEILARRRDSNITTPSSLISNLDPAVERAIMRCLEDDPVHRPASALAVAAQLPGGDPLAAALAAGETPSPQMVAAAGGDENALAPGAAIAESFGYPDAPVDADWWIDPDGDRVAAIKEGSDSPTRWTDAVGKRPTQWHFHYRESPRWQVPGDDVSVGWHDPPRLYSGMIAVLLEADGRLTSFDAVPPQTVASMTDAVPDAEIDWTVAFEAAGLDFDSFTETEPARIPLHHCEHPRAWTGTFAAADDREVRIEACSLGGKVISFETLLPTSPAWRETNPTQTGAQRVQATAVLSIFVLGLGGGILLARRNLRMGRGDRKGAFRLATLVVVLNLTSWITRASHVPTFDELEVFVRQAGSALFLGALIWTMYIAIEPFVRRRWPQTLVSWARALSGKVRDPLVGRHVLAGAAIGAMLGVVREVAVVAPGWLGWPAATPHGVEWRALGAVAALGSSLAGVMFNLLIAIGSLFLIVLLQTVVRRFRIAATLFVLVLGLVSGTAWDYPLVGAVVWMLTFTAMIFTIVRFGLLAAVALSYFAVVSFHHILTLDLTAWYAQSAIIVMTFYVAVVGFAYWASLGGRSLLAVDE